MRVSLVWVLVVRIKNLYTILILQWGVQLAQIVSCVGPLLGACPSLIPHTRAICATTFIIIIPAVLGSGEESPRSGCRSRTGRHQKQ